MQALTSVLIVDDEIDLATLLCLIFDMAGFRVAHAVNGQLGLATLPIFQPDVVVLDVEMPELDGPGMAAAMLVHDCGQENIPIVLLSGAPDVDLIAARVGTPYFLEKPVDTDTVLAMVRKAARDRQPPRPVDGFGGHHAVVA
ncbi:MAG: response regulator [Candidatus Sericytochromatia bacterium]|nr:response regulator [Candidatus Sericytochromatia bacterium]